MALMESGAKMPERDKDPRVQEKPDDQKGGPEGTRDAGSAFRPLRDSGGLSPSVAGPGPLQRDLHTQRSEIPSDQIAQPSGISNRNAIASSYSSTGGFPWVKRRKGPASSHCQLPLTSSKTVSEVSPQAVSQGQAQCEKAADSAPGEKPAPRSGSPTSQASMPHRRKFPLLPRRRGEPLRLPSPLQLGFRVTAEDLELEKKAEIMWLNSFLQGEEKSLWECRASLLSHALSSLATGTSPQPAVPKASSTDAQQERCKSQDGLDPIALQASAAGSLSRPPVSGRKCRSAGPLVSSLDTLPSTSAHSQDSAQASSFAPTRPDQGTPAHSAAGASLLTTSTSSPCTKRKSIWAADKAGILPDPSSASLIALARQRVSDFALLQKLDAIATAITQPKPVVLHGRQQGTHTLKRVHPYSRPAASAAAQASSSAPTRTAQGTTAHSVAGVSLPTTSTSSLAGTLSNPSSASLITTLARVTISGPTSVLKLTVTTAAITQPKPVVLHGQQQGTRGLKQPHPSSHPAASAAAQASSSVPTQPAQGTTAQSAEGVSLLTTSTSSLAGTLSNPSSASHTTTLAKQRVSDFTLLQKLDTIATAITQPKPVVLHGQQRGTRTLKRVHPYSHPASSAAAQASSSAPTRPAQGTAVQSAAGVSLPTTSTSSLTGTLSNPSSASLITALARLTISGPTSVLKLAVTTAATTQPKPVVLHGQQQGTHGLKQPHPSSHPAASAAAQASSSAPTQPAQGTTAQSAAGVSLPTTSTSSLVGTLSNPSSASLITALARLTISGPTSVLKLAVTTAATTQPKPVVLQGTHGLKQPHLSSHPAASAAAQASSSAPTQPAQGTTAQSAAGVSLPTTSTSSLAGILSNPSSASLITALARLTISGPSSVLKLPVTTAATTQPKPVVLHGQQQGIRGVKRARPYSDPAALALSPPTKRKSTWAAALAGTLSNPSSASLITSLARSRVSHRNSVLKLPVTAAATTQPKPVVLHGQQQGTRGMKRARPYSDPAALALSPPTKKKLNWAAALAGTLSNPPSASLITSLARPRVSRRTSLRKLPVTAAATTQPKPVVLHGQQQGTRGLKWVRLYSDPAALALSTPTKRKLNWAAALAGTLSNTSSACLITSLARTSVSCRTSLRKLAVMAAAITQPKPVVLHGQQQGARTLRRVHRYSHPAASAATQASSSAPRQPAQGTTAHSPAGVSLPTTSTSSLAGTLSNPSSSSPHDAHAASSDSTAAKVKRLR
ncbi:hypothetical protein P7K49_029686 [Saguinus oedipus]|uniref:Uncharacterized protein n=1 Tax=Saguinus oedipus TaxID=9490 RepID=A0ABQ9U9X6_SAGOE|nr:hypothetical protein P7K49_029686 [Saguinus oedipus]